MAKTEVHQGKYSGKLVLAEDIDRLRAEGYKAMDPHVHTSSSNDVFPAPYLSPAALYQKMDNEGFDFITFTDHDTQDGYGRLGGDLAGKQDGKLPEKTGALDKLVGGVEIKIKPAYIKGYPGKNPHTLHNNVYLASPGQFEDLEGLAKRHDFYGFIDYCRRNELPFTYNHPTWCEPHEMPNWELLPGIIKEYDVIEVFNRGRVSQQNGLSLKLAERMGKGIVSSSDTHIGFPARATLARGADFGEFWEHVKAGESLAVPGSADYGIMRDQVLGWIKAFSASNKAELAAKGYHFSTGSKNIDRLINFLTGDDIEKRRVEKNILPLMIKLAIYSIGRPVVNPLYISKQRKIAEDIEELVLEGGVSLV